MTQKELLYIEDAYGHEKNIIAIVNDTINNLEDKKLISFLKKEVKKHEQMMKKLLKILEDKSND